MAIYLPPSTLALILAHRLKSHFIHLVLAVIGTLLFIFSGTQRLSLRHSRIELRLITLIPEHDWLFDCVFMTIRPLQNNYFRANIRIDAFTSI